MEEELTGITWTTREGIEMDIANMDDDHLKNAYKYTARRWPWREEFIIPLANEIKLRGLPWYGG
jgi:hypothetical protein